LVTKGSGGRAHGPAKKKGEKVQKRLKDGGENSTKPSGVCLKRKPRPKSATGAVVIKSNGVGVTGGESEVQDSRPAWLANCVCPKKSNGEEKRQEETHLDRKRKRAGKKNAAITGASGGPWPRGKGEEMPSPSVSGANLGNSKKRGGQNEERFRKQLRRRVWGEEERAADGSKTGGNA